MGSTYLQLTNKLLRSFNEVELTSSNFSSAIGVHAAAKDFVNYAIQWIYEQEVEWPFSYTRLTVDLVAGTYEYSLSANIIKPDWESFRIKEDIPSSTYNARYLPYITYERFLVFGYLDRLKNASSTDRGEPEFVANGPDNKVFVGPLPPDVAYDLEYDGYAAATDLSAHGDTTAIPTIWNRVIVTKAREFMYKFRDNHEMAALEEQRAKEGIKNMRTVLMNKYQSVYDTRSDFKLRTYW